MYLKTGNDIFRNCLTISEISQKTQQFNFYQELYSEFLKNQNVFGNSEFKKTQATKTVKFNSVFSKLKFFEQKAEKNINFLDMLYKNFSEYQTFNNEQDFMEWYYSALEKYREHQKILDEHEKNKQDHEKMTREKTLNLSVFCRKFLEFYSQKQNRRDFLTLEIFQDVKSAILVNFFENEQELSKNFDFSYNIEKKHNVLYSENIVFTFSDNTEKKKFCKQLSVYGNEFLRREFPKHTVDNIQQNVKFVSIQQLIENGYDLKTNDFDFSTKKYFVEKKNQEIFSEITKNLKLTPIQEIVFDEFLVNGNSVKDILNYFSDIFSNEQEIYSVLTNVKRKIFTLAKKSKNSDFWKMYSLYASANNE